MFIKQDGEEFSMAKNTPKIKVISDTDSLERDTIERVQKTLTTLDGFLSRWDAAKVKPEAVKGEVTRIRKFYTALSEWQRTAERTKGRGNEEERLVRLHEFVQLCQKYS